MRVCVLGLWHLGSVLSAAIARHHETVGADPDESLVNALAKGEPPLDEPGLADLVGEGLRSCRLRFTTEQASAVAAADVVWLAFDVPLDEYGAGDWGAVMSQALGVLSSIADGALLVVSSQVPAGFTAMIAAQLESARPGAAIRVAYAPENLQVGRALATLHRTRWLIGTRDARPDETLSDLLGPLADEVVYTTLETAEMTKHALNAFLAASVAFANEVAKVCEGVGADAATVLEAVRDDARIGPRAYLRPGSAYAGGTLARDVGYLTGLAAATGTEVPLLDGVRGSNERHEDWPHETLSRLLGDLQGARVAVVGLSYKAGLATLRGSSGVKLCRTLADAGASVVVYDPLVSADLGHRVDEATTVIAALTDADAVVVLTAVGGVESLAPQDLIDRMRRPVAIDPSRILSPHVRADRRIMYAAVGLPRTSA